MKRPKGALNTVTVFLTVLLCLNSSDICALNEPTHAAIIGFIADNPVMGFYLDQYLRQELGWDSGKETDLQGRRCDNGWNTVEIKKTRRFSAHSTIIMIPRELGTLQGYGGESSRDRPLCGHRPRTSHGAFIPGGT
jgi:hypothetical protein